MPESTPRTCLVDGCGVSVGTWDSTCADHGGWWPCSDCGQWYPGTVFDCETTACVEARMEPEEDEEYFDDDDEPNEVRVECNRCGYDFDSLNRVDVNSGTSRDWCQGCCDSHAEWCDDCHRYHAIGHDCPNATLAVERYNFNPSALTFFHAPGERRDPTTTEYVGMELEVAFNRMRRSDALHRLRELLDGEQDVYLKHDGSIANGRCGEGVELVTHPGSWAYWAHPDTIAVWNYRLQEMQRQGFRSFDAQSCGLHFHVSRVLLTGTTLVRLQSLVYDNATLFKRVSQRRNFEYCSFEREDATDDRYRVCKAGTAKYSMRFRNFQYNPDDNAYRRVALNLPNDTPTVEFRFLRGTLHAPSFWKSFECVRACVEFARSQPKEAMRELEFLAWLAARGAEYPHLVAFLNRWYAEALRPPRPRGLRTPTPEFIDHMRNRTNEPLVGA